MHSADILIELGAVVIGLAILARVAGRFGIPAIPLYLLAGLAFGKGGILPLVTTAEFIGVGAEIGLILLLFMLGLEYSASELVSTLRREAPTGVLDIALNFTPGLLGGLLLGWGLLAAVLLGGICYVSSSGVIAKLLQDAPPSRPERPLILSALVMEDLTMALFLPIIAGLLIGGTDWSGLISAVLAVAGVGVILLLATRVDVGLSRLLFSRSDEALLLTIVGLTLAVAGIAERVQVSAAVGALVVGIVLAGPAAKSAQALLSPLRDLFAALFFGFFGLTVDPSSIVPVLRPALLLAAVTAITKLATGLLSARRHGLGRPEGIRMGTVLMARGEFSIALAGLGVAAGLETDLGPLAAAYVLLLAVLGPLIARLVDVATERGSPASIDNAGS
ncbi:MAG: monovalent cation:H+ antiporter-2, family [Actinomycetota bacterium]|nr:monovalent cation:H+ antiporter-2, family [Actinomycetota bacterium]